MFPARTMLTTAAAEVYEFLVVSSQGKVFSFKNIDLPTLRDAIDHGDMSQVQAVSTLPYHHCTLPPILPCRTGQGRHPDVNL